MTHSYTLACVLFRLRKNVLIVSDTEAQAVAFLGNIKMELVENEIIKQDFAIKGLLKENETEIIVEFHDGALFRITARGATQKLRGMTWRGMRPDLVICDDFENDEAVSNEERRDKFKSWLLGALMPVGGDGCLFRIVGTILHNDSMLENLLNDTAWKTARFSAHNEDFSEILWPEKFTEESLRAKQRMYTNQGKADVYSREFLNIPISADQAYFKPSYFLPIEDPDEALNYYITCDLAVSTSIKADYSVFAVGGVNSKNVLKVPLVIRERMDSLEIVNTLFRLNARYKPKLIGIEGGAIAKSILPVLNAEMLRRGEFFEVITMPPIGDKRARAQSIRARMIQGAVQFDMKAPWYPTLLQEMLVFDRGSHDDQVDAMAWLGQLLDKMIEAPTVKELEDEAYYEMLQETGEAFGDDICYETGY